ncbi:serine/threonine protein kinase, partial [Thecamonas trahens ATCC 50062]
RGTLGLVVVAVVVMLVEAGTGEATRVTRPGVSDGSMREGLGGGAGGSGTQQEHSDPSMLAYKVLSQLFLDTGGPSWTSSTNWLANLFVCSWEGVHCTSGFETVVGLDLSNNNLVGRIPAYLFNITTLSSIDFSTNVLRGTFPDISGTALTTVAISNNQFDSIDNVFLAPALNELHANYALAPRVGPLRHVPRNPVQGGSSTVAYLSLRGNMITTGFDQAFLNSVPSLEFLDLSFNELATRIDNLTLPQFLDFLDLKSNSLVGGLPSNLPFGQFYLANNSLTGMISYGDAQTLDLSFNNFDGALSEDVPDTLVTFSADHNLLTGQIPNGLACSDTIRYCDLGGQEGPEPLKCPSKCIRNHCQVYQCSSCGLSACSSSDECQEAGGPCNLCINHKCQAPPPPPSPPAPPPPPAPIPPPSPPSPPPSAHSRSPSGLSKGKTVAVVLVVVLVVVCVAGFVVLQRVLKPGGRARGSRSGGETSTLLPKPSVLQQYTSNLNASYTIDEVDPAVSSLFIPLADISLGPELGRGTYGSVYFATWNGRPCAVKDMRLNGEDVQVALHEIGVMAQLQHPNIVELYGFSRGDVSVYIVMELVEGGSLREFVSYAAQHLDLVMATKIAILQEVVAGLEFMHSHGVLHRDIKSANILLQMEGDEVLAAKLADFGFAKVRADSGSLASIQTIRGTPVYMAPELLLQYYQGAAEACYSKAADIFSLSIVAYEMLTESILFRAKRFSAAMTASGRRPPFNDEFATRYPQLVELISHAWAANPVDRPSISEFAAALDLVAEQLPADDGPLLRRDDV